MDPLFSRLTLYDFLAMALPGSLFVMIFFSTPCLNLPIPVIAECHNKGLFYLILAGVAYLCGLINNSIMDLLWLPFRNNPQHIILIRDIVQGKTCKTLVCCASLIILSFLAVIVLSISIVGGIWSVVLMYAILFLIASALQCSNEDVVLDYYSDYERVMQGRGKNDKALKRKNSEANSIKIIEHQVVFMRNMIIPLLLCSHLFKPVGIPHCICFQHCIITGCVLLLVATILRQSKVYWIVYEYFLYAK